MGSSIRDHLKKKHSLHKTVLKAMVNEALEWDLVDSQTEVDLPLLGPRIEHLVLRRDGFKCLQCSYICTSRRVIEKHCVGECSGAQSR